MSTPTPPLGSRPSSHATLVAMKMHAAMSADEDTAMSSNIDPNAAARPLPTTRSSTSSAALNAGAAATATDRRQGRRKLAANHRPAYAARNLGQLPSASGDSPVERVTLIHAIVAITHALRLLITPYAANAPRPA